MIPRIRLCILNRTGSKAFGARNHDDLLPMPAARRIAADIAKLPEAAVSLDPPTTLPKNDLLGGSLPPPDFASRAFVLSFDLGGDRAKGGERGFVFPIGSFTFRRPGLCAVACHLGLDHPLYSFLPLRIPGLIFKVRRH